MASPSGPAARLRRTFHYPNDSDSDADSQPETMDEQEQDHLIHLLATENASRNTQFIRLLLSLPLLTTVAYVRPLFRPATTMFSMLSITSLLVSALLLHRLPPTETGFSAVDAWASRSGRRKNEDVAARRGYLGRGAGGGLGRVVGDRSPLETYLPYLNLGLVALLMVMGLVRGDDRGGGFGWVSMGNLPALVYSVCLTAKIVMAGVDPERDLSGLRYEFKGA